MKLVCVIVWHAYNGLNVPEIDFKVFLLQLELDMERWVKLRSFFFLGPILPKDNHYKSSCYKYSTFQPEMKNWRLVISHIF